MVNKYVVSNLKPGTKNQFQFTFFTCKKTALGFQKGLKSAGILKVILKKAQK